VRRAATGAVFEVIKVSKGDEAAQRFCKVVEDSVAEANAFTENRESTD
jgi:hypothetical protein